MDEKGDRRRGDKHKIVVEAVRKRLGTDEKYSKRGEVGSTAIEKKRSGKAVSSFRLDESKNLMRSF